MDWTKVLLAIVALYSCVRVRQWTIGVDARGEAQRAIARAQRTSRIAAARAKRRA